MIYIASAIFIHLYYYFSAILNHSLDYWIPWGTVHNWQGWDYYQIPNGAYSFLHGGELTGIPPDGIGGYSFGSENVYHPLFTLILGYPLQFFRPYEGFIFWVMLHAVLTITISLVFFRKFRRSKYCHFAIILSLIYFPQYLEIWNGQYHFLLNAAVFFLLIEFLKKDDSFKTGMLFVISLLVKPIGLLWIPTLLMHKKWKTVIYGILLFILSTLPFSINNHDTYYLSNLYVRISSPFGGPPSIFTIDAILRFLHVPWFIPILIKSVIAVGLVWLMHKLKIDLFVSLFLLTSYYLLFYDLVFEYHYTILVPFIMIGLVTHRLFQTKFARIIFLSLALPTPFVVMHYFQIGAQGWNVTNWGWMLLVLFRTVPLIAYNVYLLKNVKNYQRKMPPR